jgi:tryptophan halogenase
MKIVIVGGGTAGWLTAAMIVKTNAILKKEGLEPVYDITVIESSNVPIIGAGEGSTGLFQEAIVSRFKDLGINELDFINQTGATLKMGIRLKDWNGIGTEFLSPIQPSDTYKYNIDLNFLSCLSNGNVSDASFCGYLLGRDLSSYNFDRIKTTGHHSYHFDAHKVGKYLKSICIKHGVKNIDGEIASLNRNSLNGNLESVVLKETTEVITSNFWIDCSGFARVLVKPMGAGWVSYSNQLPANGAIPFIEKYENTDKVKLETLAWAQPNGWMWRIPTEERYGSGYVFSDMFTTADKAVDELEKNIGKKIEPIKHLKFETGRLEKFWINNVIGMGLAGSFLEPLEATSIHTTLIQLDTFCHHFLYNDIETISVDSIRNKYNTHIGGLVDEFRDLIQLHYMTTREDTDFWKFCKYSLQKTDNVKYVLEVSKHMSLSYFDFPSWHGSAGWGVWSWTLAGLGHITKETADKTLKNFCMYGDSKKAYEQIIKNSKIKAIPLMSSDEFMKTLWNKKLGKR